MKARSGTKLEAHSVPRMEVRRGTKMEAHSAPRMEARSGTKMEAHSAPRMKARSGTKMEAHSAPRMKARSGTNMEAHSAPRMEAHNAATGHYEMGHQTFTAFLDSSLGSCWWHWAFHTGPCWVPFRSCRLLASRNCNSLLWIRTAIC